MLLPRLILYSVFYAFHFFFNFQNEDIILRDERIGIFSKFDLFWIG